MIQQSLGIIDFDEEEREDGKNHTLTNNLSNKRDSDTYGSNLADIADRERSLLEFCSDAATKMDHKNLRFATLIQMIQSNFSAWDKIFELSKGDINTPQYLEDKRSRVLLICESLRDFCLSSDISMESLPRDLLKLYVEVNKKMDKEPFLLPTYSTDNIPAAIRERVSLVVGSSFIPDRIEEMWFKTSNALARSLYSSNCKLLTIGRSVTPGREMDHFRCEVGVGEEMNLKAGFDELLAPYMNERVIIFFTLAVHQPSVNLALMDSFCESFRSSILVQTLKANRHLSLVVTGTDAILPSTSSTFYKAPSVLPHTAVVPAGYSCSKLYQVINGAMLMADEHQYEELHRLLDELVDVMRCKADPPSERYAYLTANQFNAKDIENYDKIANKALPLIEQVRGYAWVKHLSYMFSSMQVTRIIDASKKSSIDASDLDLVLDQICGNVVFRAKNAITPRMAASYHIEAAMIAISSG
jgi:hypothetical protein